MTGAIHPIALFRLSVLGPLASRDELERGEVKRLIRELASRTYHIPDSDRVRLGEGTIEAWYYAWRRGGINALAPKQRSDRGESKLPMVVQETILKAKREKPTRSINTIVTLLENSGLVAQGQLSRSAIHRLLQHHGISCSRGHPQAPSEELRSFVAQRAGDIWYGDVMHGPKCFISGKNRKVYLVSLMDDASRLLTHSAFCTGETALDIEGVLKQAVLKRGLPRKLVIDNGSAYRANTLQAVCARLEIRLIYCRPYHPTSKGKLEKWHSFVRSAFLNELDLRSIHSLDDINSRLWAWVETFYHPRAHAGLEGLTPLSRWQQDLIHIRPLGAFARKVDEIFLHRHSRKVRKDATVSFQGRFFEVPFELSGKKVVLVVDPHADSVVAVESVDGKHLGLVTPLDAIANLNRKRVHSEFGGEQQLNSKKEPTLNLVESTYQKHISRISIGSPSRLED